MLIKGYSVNGMLENKGFSHVTFENKARLRIELSERNALNLGCFVRFKDVNPYLG